MMENTRQLLCLRVRRRNKTTTIHYVPKVWLEEKRSTPPHLYRCED
jgi:hypothetical protein